jgi:hypothetical protein
LGIGHSMTGCEDKSDLERRFDSEHLSPCLI